MKEIIAIAPLCVLLYTATAYEEQTNKQYSQQNTQLFTYQDTSSAAKKNNRNILHKIYTEKVQ